MSQAFFYLRGFHFLQSVRLAADELGYFSSEF